MDGPTVAPARVGDRVVAKFRGAGGGHWYLARVQRVNAADGTFDVEERRALMVELETIMQEDGPITQPLWMNVFSSMDKRVKGYNANAQLLLFGEEVSLDA